MEGKAQKRDRNRVGGLFGQTSQDFIGCPQCSCPNAPRSMTPARGRLSQEWGWLKRDLSNSWPHALEADTHTLPCLFPQAQLPAAAFSAMPEPGAHPGAAEMSSMTWPPCHLPSPPQGIPHRVHRPVEGTLAGRGAVPCPGACLHHGIPQETPQ